MLAMIEYKWIVHPYSFAEREHREISVVHESNFHGLKSYGWFDDRKIFIANDSMYGTLNDEVAKAAIQIANDMADKLNSDNPVPQEEVNSAIEYKKKQDDRLSELFRPMAESLRKDLDKAFLDAFERYEKDGGSDGKTN